LNFDDFVKRPLKRHPGESRGSELLAIKIPAFAGMTNLMEFRLLTKSSILGIEFFLLFGAWNLEFSALSLCPLGLCGEKL
jgi:hypothetical protein